MSYVTILFLLRFSYYSAQNAWFNLILLGYLINVVAVSYKNLDVYKRQV